MVNRRRKWRAEKQDIYIKEELGSNAYLVSGSRGKDYQVDLNNPSCTCPDWEKRTPRGGCKHILHVKIEQGLIDPVPGAKTNFGNPSSRSQPDYPSNWGSLSRRTKKRDDWTCQKCGAKGGPHGNADLAAHHMVPKSRGGKDEVDNLITVCNSCHEQEHGHSIPQGTGRSSYSTTGQTKGQDTASTGSKGTGRSSFSSNSGTKEQHTSSNDNSRTPSYDRPKGKSGYVYTAENDYDPGNPAIPTSNSDSVIDSDDSESRSYSLNKKTEGSSPSIPKVIDDDEHNSIDPLTGPLFGSLITFAILGTVGAIISAGQVIWAAILVVSVSTCLLLRRSIKWKQGLIDDLRRINEELESGIQELNSEAGYGRKVDQEKLERVEELFEEADDITTLIEEHLSDEYLKWLSDSKDELETSYDAIVTPDEGKTPGSERRAYVSKDLDERQLHRGQR